MMARLIPSLAILLILACFTHAQNLPQVKVNYFQNLPAKLYFFDDTTVRGALSIMRDTPRG